MDTQTILFAVKAEISRLQKVVDVLEPSTTTKPASVINPAKKGHVWTQAQRAEMSRKLRASWTKRLKRSAKK